MDRSIQNRSLEKKWAVAFIILGLLLSLGMELIHEFWDVDFSFISILYGIGVIFAGMGLWFYFRNSEEVEIQWMAYILLLIAVGLGVWKIIGGL